MYFDLMEIIPAVVGDYRFNKHNQKVSRFSKEVEVRALIEGQFLSKRIHAEKLGYTTGKSSRVLVTGGASANKSIIQVLADVFNTPVYVQEISNSACLGSAYRAKHGLIGTKSFDETVEIGPEFQLAAKPMKDAAEIYDAMAERYKLLEEMILQKQ
ncbi:xylulose kinase-like [Centruroides sculpturatus]|uniref:xylulose kinase-like n=1 Tax=Centruroides sculpturatus TaxID=218467 RepID=UPI000C6D6D75|nr:xylulose kinase-like [Centruroides sculpturatus]